MSKFKVGDYVDVCPKAAKEYGLRGYLKGIITRIEDNMFFVKWDNFDHEVNYYDFELISHNKTKNNQTVNKYLGVK